MGQLAMLHFQNSSRVKPNFRKPRARPTKCCAMRAAISTAAAECTESPPGRLASEDSSNSFAFFSGWNWVPKKGNPSLPSTTETNSCPRRSTLVASTCQNFESVSLFSKSEVETPASWKCHVTFSRAVARFRSSGQSASNGDTLPCCVKFRGSMIFSDAQPEVNGPGAGSPEEYSMSCSKPKQVPHTGMRSCNALVKIFELKLPYGASSLMATPPPGKSKPFTRASNASTSAAGAS
mmetsp:Transcript_127806/g.409252  ORF Transcript_127806/g.409252 Transcript_127806/m.409252 type:complete len:236 (+) Transcript_127806:301-1008(+)